MKKKFGTKTVKFYISNSKEINAFAVGSFGRKAVVLTEGIINHYAENSENEEEFLLAIKSILGHEMSHLINKDFLPGILMITNQKVTNFASFILGIAFNVFVFLYIDFNNVWKWLGYTRKSDAKRLLEKNFTIDIDFKIEKAAAEVSAAAFDTINGGQNFTIDIDFKVEKAAPPIGGAAFDTI